MAGNNNNITLSAPGPHWQVFWTDGLGDLQLDIVGFLAVLGEGSVNANAQVSALSRLFYLPRLMPAPQALLWPNRPATLPPSPASVTAVFSGNVKDHVHHVANILLEHQAKPFTVRCVHVTKKKQILGVSLVDRVLRGMPKLTPQRRKTISPQNDTSTVKAKATGPLAWVTILGFTLSLGLFVGSLTVGDGWSTLATILLSLLSTLIGIGNKWNLRLPSRPKGSRTPDGDVVIRYPGGSYLIVRCDEGVARELYFAPEEIEYSVTSAAIYRMISLMGTLMLMLGVVCLANARLQLQLAWGGAYIVMNIAHWTAAALPARLHWDLSCYEVFEEGVEGGCENKSFTEALWKAILLTKSTRWVRNGKAAPQTDTWDKWLEQCGEYAEKMGWREGKLEDPLWSGHISQTEGRIWKVPKGWDAKEAWNQIHDELEPSNKPECTLEEEKQRVEV